MGTYNLDVASESGSVISVSLSDLAGAIENDTNGQITLRLSANNSGALKFASLGNTLGHPGPSLKVEFQSSPPVAATETSFADSVEGTGQLAEPLLGLFSSTSRHYPGRLDEDLEWTMKEFYFREINSKNELTVADSEEQLKWEDWLHVISTHNISIRQDTSPYNRLIWLYEDPAFTGRTFRNGDTVAERYEAATRMLSEGFKLLSLHGLHNELGSDQYNERSHRAIYQLLDYAVDPVLRQRITMWHDIFLTDYAQMSLNGLRGGSKERPKDGGLNDRLNGFLSFLNGEWGTMHELPGFNGYRLPEPALLLRWLGPTEPSYVMRNRLPGEKESVGSQTKGKLKSSTFNYAYRTPEYITGCGMVDFKQGGWGQWCGVNFKNLGSIYMRAWDDNGDRWYAQDKDVMIAQRYPGAFYNGDGGLYFTPTLEKVERDGWVFARTPDGNAYAAVRFVSGTSYWNEPARFKLLPDPNDYYSPVILQAGRKIDYASFEDFQDAILAAPLTVTAEKVDYTGPNSKRIEFFRGDDPFVAPKIDGEPINFEYDFNYRSPFIQNEGESDRVTLRYGRKLWIYDLENNTITETEAAPAPVSAAASESETGYGPENAIDGDLTPASHWSAPGAAQSITIDYGQSQTFTEVDIAWLSSDSRAADFELQVSSDGVIFTPALGLSTSSLTAEGDYESFDLPMVSGRYLRYIGMGNSVDDGNQVIEIRAYGFRDGQDPVVEPTPISTERLLTPLSVSASSELTPNYAKEKAFDFDMNRESRWSALGDSQSITYEYPFPMLIDRVDIAWLSSDERSTEFELQISDFGNEWTTVYGRAASSIHPEAAVEAYAITPTSGRFLRCIAYGNSENDWNHIIEMHAYGELDTSPPFAAGGLELWLDAEDLDGDFFTEGSAESGLSGTVVELWKDKSGNGRDAIGVDGKSGLNLADGALNGRAVVRSSGDDQLDIGGSAFAVQTVIAVVDASQEPFNSFRRIMRSPTGGLDSAVVNALLVNGANGTSIFSTLPETGAEDVNLIIDGVDTNVADNSETFGSPHSQHRIVVVGAGAATRSVADWYISEEDTGNHWLGDIAELIVYNRALSPAEIEEVGTYLEVKWGIQSAYGTFEVSTLNPLDGALGVSIDADLALSFNEDVQAGSGDITIRRVSDDSVVEVIAVSTGQVSIDGKTVTINPAGNLDYFTDYYVEVANGALEDLNGADFSGFTGDTTWQFKTEYEPGLVWHSRLDGDAVDTVGTVDGTLNGNTTATADRFGDAASALLFDGDGDNVIIDKTTLSASFSAGTISVWVQADPADTQTDDGFIGVGGTGGGNDQFFALQVNGDRYRADFDRGGSGATGRLDALTASEIDSNWHHVIATFDAAAQDSLRLYVDGVPVDSENISSASLMIPTNNWTVGSSRTSERYWPGRVDDAGVWNKALTADEVKSLHDLTASSDLKYSASEFEQLRRIHAAGSGNVIIGDLEWTYATSLTPAAGLSGSSASGFTLVFDAAADTGLESAPASASVSLSVLSDGNGMIASSVNGAHAVGTTVEVDPIPNTYYSWGNWSGDVPGGQVNDDPLQLLMDQDRTITANFTADLAVNDVPHWWLAQYGWTSDFDAFAVLDDDGDSLFAWEEYLAGTNPTDANSVFKVLSTEMVPESGDLVMTWPSVAGQDYYILQSWDLKAWWRVSDAIAATPPINTYTQVIDSDPVAFYRVAINPPASLMVDFSSTQGYSNGSLNGQPSNGLTWSENGLGTYQVDAAAGTVTIDSNDASFRTAQLDVTIGAATTATLVTEFTITAGTVQPVSTVPFLRSDLITQTNGLAFVTMRQLNSGENNRELQFFESSDASSFFNTSTIGGAEIGLLVSGGSFTDDESDGLRMTARCTLTDGQTQWEAEIKLENLETGAVIRTVTGQWEATNGFRDADKFFRLSTGAINNYGDGGGTQVDIHRVIFTE